MSKLCQPQRWGGENPLLGGAHTTPETLELLLVLSLASIEERIFAVSKSGAGFFHNSFLASDFNGQNFQLYGMGKSFIQGREAVPTSQGHISDCIPC